jgi:hypothetical protein
MQITLIRKPSAKGCTLSTWYVNGQYECVGLEDVVRPAGQYMYGATAIPTGTYRISVERSPDFSARAGHDVYLPTFQDIPGKVQLFGGRPVGACGVHFHGGNRAIDTKGCPLAGSRFGADGASVEASQAAFQPLFAKVQAALHAGEEVFFTVR